MNISPVSHVPAVATPARLDHQQRVRGGSEGGHGDGDGRTGAAALNDGDAAAQSARRGAIDVKA